MKITFAEATLPATGTLVLGVGQNRQLSETGRVLDERTGGAVTRAMEAARFAGKTDDVLTLLAPANLELERLLLVGLGEAEKITDLSWQRFGAAIVAALATSGAQDAFVPVELPATSTDVSSANVAAQIALGAQLRAYRFDKYRTTQKKDKKPTLKKLHLLSADHNAARHAFERYDHVAEGVSLTRDLVSEPANVLTPVTLAERCEALAGKGLTVEVLDEKRLNKLGMGALLGVAQGSAQPARLVVLRWNGAPEAAEQAPLAFVGKGVTFDSGGISIKAAAGMEDMKWDMAGAAVVVGLMTVLANRKARVNAIGIIALVENMPSASAQRPGDVVTSASGQTIEVINTDAEGRLVLADALWYAQEHAKPRLIVDLATLTGAIIVALGSDQAGLFSNDDELAERLTRSGIKTGEPVWRMPLGDSYDKEINSDIADVKNVAANRNAGSIIGAQFLKRFIRDGMPWAHLDIAGVTWSKKDEGVVPKGGTGFGVRLLDRLVQDYYEA
ncbi:MAG: leucyl aminopeptidase [Azospirillaceae bacterium]|nr:leucyl aminopeptidase [Azospirillaceae bacterium]